MSDYDVLVSGGGVVPAPEGATETGRVATRVTRDDTSDVSRERQQVLADTRAQGSGVARALADTRAVKRALAAASSGAPATLPGAATEAGHDTGLWALARRPSPLFGLPWGIVAGAVFVAGVVAWRHYRGSDE